MMSHMQNGYISDRKRKRMTNHKSKLKKKGEGHTVLCCVYALYSIQAQNGHVNQFKI